MSAQSAECKKQMDKAIEHLKQEFSKMRAGRASTGMVEGVKVEVYGSMMGLKEVAALGTPDAKTITISPWDRGVINDIEKAILAANLGITPVNDGKMIRINLPPMTEERRKEFVKQIKNDGEHAKVSVRNVRRDTMEALKKSLPSEDEQRRASEEIQKLTDQFIGEIDRLVDAKSKELMTL